MSHGSVYPLVFLLVRACPSSFHAAPPHGSLFSFTSKRLASQVFFDSLPRSSFGFEVLLFDVNVGNILNLKLPLSLSLSLGLM
jgi:hypothetical protein